MTMKPIGAPFLMSMLPSKDFVTCWFNSNITWWIKKIIFFLIVLDFVMSYCLFQTWYCLPLFFWKRCLICSSNFNVEVLKTHYQYHHSVDKNYFFKELFSPDNASKRCDECNIQFQNSWQKKKSTFCTVEISR